MDRTNWDEITTRAYLTLLELDVHEFPIAIKKLKLKGVKVISFQKYSKVTGVAIQEITLEHELDDAFLIKGLRPDLQIILYDIEKYPPRLRHTLLHEIGHIKCNHTAHGEVEEVEAHFFAAQANAPNAIIREINRRGYKTDVMFLMNCFGLSGESAKKKIEYLQKYHFQHTNDYDSLLLSQFQGFIDSKYPVRISQYDDDYFDELENERQNWR